jgi:hypothetical protein
MLERCPEAADERCLKCDVIDERDALVNELRDVRKDAASAIRDSARLREGIEEIQAWSKLEHRNEEWLREKLADLLAGKEQ